ncbi:MAG: DUF488 domain-containing protein [Alphaproteobacteria bacterium]|nr:DUF488 domain-containing protein [Alphaproteobacteria bacterium]MBU1526890.1 DUF488 domain-containing protein [Alphaproteobacteria bacterium]MBU2351808.1 DUF488 domain-containing protein [Alphaproteobacteria bacterium]MBU2381448.1 DUF488 domain-containing protein [Alphaproteobacteria bacterium]
MKLYTIGYEGQPQAGVIGRLKDAGVQVLVDVRAVAASRRAGFSKTVLGGSLAEADIEYVHLRGVGTPKAGREAARAGRLDDLHAIYDAHMQEPAFQLDFERLREIARDRPTAILCFCGDAGKCHRGILSARLAREDGFEVVNL